MEVICIIIWRNMAASQVRFCQRGLHLTCRLEPQVRFYAAEVALGLQHMHERHIVYRDLKPANILLCESGHAKISDLGLACDIRAKMPQAAVGTHGYMAPEVLKRGVAYSFTADWFSLGCMLYKLLRGHRLDFVSYFFILSSSKNNSNWKSGWQDHWIFVQLETIEFYQLCVTTFIWFS